MVYSREYFPVLSQHWPEPFFIWLSKSLVDVATITHDRQHLVMCGILLFLSVILRVLVNALKAHVESISFTGQSSICVSICLTGF